MANNSPKYIVIDCRISGTSTGRYSENLVKYLSEIDSRNNYLVLVRSEYLKTAPKLPDNWAYQVANYPITGSLSEQTKMLGDLKELEPDLVHFTMIQQPVFYKGRTVTTIHDLTIAESGFRNPDKNAVIYEAKRFIYRWIIRIVADKSVINIVPSNYVKEAVKRFTGQPYKKLVVTYEAADKIKVKADPMKALVGKKYIMHVGRPFPHKNVPRLIETYKVLKLKNKNLQLVIAGKIDHTYEKMKKDLVKNGVEGVVFTDFVSEGQLKWLYQNCSAYIFPSLSEGFGLPGLEAMIHGAPVICSNSTSLPEIYGDAASYFDPTNVNSMAIAINKVLKDEDYRKSLIRKGYKQADKYSWQRMAEETLNVYERALNS